MAPGRKENHYRHIQLRQRSQRCRHRGSKGDCTMSEDKTFKMRPGEKDDFERWARLTSASITGEGVYQFFLSQPSSRFVADFVPPDYLIDGLLQRRFCYSLTAPTGAGKT